MPTDDELSAIAMRLVLTALNQDHDMRIRTLHEVENADDLRGVVNVLASVAAKSWLDICNGDRTEAMKSVEKLLARQLDAND